jgi:chorismate dehydratase
MPASRPRVAAVSFLNAKPLLHGLDEEVDLCLDVPSRLLSGLESGAYDVALLPVADVPRLLGAGGGPGGGQVLYQGGGIACDGYTLTVRIFSDRPLNKITRLLCDTDSHTSVNLARVILRERYGVEPEFVPHPRGAAPSGPVLLIGDKVITDPPPFLPVHFDLGWEWKQMTGLPFVFAVWTARPGFDASELVPVLARCRDAGLAANIDLAKQYAPRHGWPIDIAITYFTQYLRYTLGKAYQEAVPLFWEKAGLV